MASTRIYEVTNVETKAVRLVECKSRNTARNHVANQVLQVRAASARDLRRHLAAGLKVEDAGRAEQLPLEPEADEAPQDDQQDDAPVGGYLTAQCMPEMPSAQLLDVDQP